MGKGYYDLATPFFAAEYTFDHLSLDDSLRAHLSGGYYEAGHMMYVHHPSLVKLKADLAQFIQDSMDAKIGSREGRSEVKKLLRLPRAWIAIAIGGALALGKIALYRGEAISATWFVIAAVVLLPGGLPAVLGIYFRKNSGAGRYARDSRGAPG